MPSPARVNVNSDERSRDEDQRWPACANCQGTGQDAASAVPAASRRGSGERLKWAQPAANADANRRALFATMRSLFLCGEG